MVKANSQLMKSSEELKKLYNKTLDKIKSGKIESAPAAIFHITQHPEKCLDKNDFANFILRLTRMFPKLSEEYTDEKRPEYQKALALYRMAVKEGYSKIEFDDAITRFEKYFNSYGDWKYSDILKEDKRFQLHSQEWYMKQLEKFSPASFRIYDIDGVPMYAFASERKLPFPEWVPRQPKVVPVQVEEWKINTQLSETQKRVNRLLAKQQEELTNEDKTFLMRNKKPPLSDKVNEILEKIK